MCVCFLEKYVRCHDSSETCVTKKDKLRCVEGVFRFIKDEWKENIKVRTKIGKVGN